MNKGNRFFNWLKNPHGIALIAIYAATVAAGAGAIYIAAACEFDFPINILAYALYVLAAVLLGYSAYSIVKMLPAAKQKIIDSLKKWNFTRMLLEQFDFRTLIFAMGSCFLSLIYAVYNGVLGAVIASWWNISFGIYYLILALMRGNILFYHYKKKERDIPLEEEKRLEIKAYRASGIMFVLLPICLSVAIGLMVRGEHVFRYYSFTIYVAAVYAFYKIIMSVVNIIKARKTDDFSIRGIRSVNVADGLLSILALQTALLAESAEANSGLYNSLVGGGVCILTFAMGVYIIVNATRHLKKADLVQSEKS